MTDYITATNVYKDYSLPRSVLHDLVEDGRVEMRTKNLYGNKVLKLYKRKDIERYLNSND